MRAAFFDLDKTLIAKSSLVAFGPEFHARGLINKRVALTIVLNNLLFQRFGADEEKLAKIRESTLKITKGWDHLEVKKIVAETINDIVEPLIYREALDLIDFHLGCGDEVWLVSMSPSEVVEPFAELLGLTGAVASRARIDAEGRFTGELEYFNNGANKAESIRALAAERGIDLADSFAYSDSETDVPMLRAVGHPFAVNPDRTLAKIAHDESWPVLSFTHPVTARRRRSHTPFLVSALALATLTVLNGRRRRT